MNIPFVQMREKKSEALPLLFLGGRIEEKCFWSLMTISLISSDPNPPKKGETQHRVISEVSHEYTFHNGKMLLLLLMVRESFNDTS